MIKLNLNTDDMNNYLVETQLLDYSHPSIQELIKQRQWEKLGTTERIKAIYNFVRDEIKFGYNISDDIAASLVLKDGYGQCNTKATLLMTLLRATKIPSRLHGFTIDKTLQKGAITGIAYLLSPQNILHSWVEVLVEEQWYYLEGVILDKSYLIKLQQKNNDCKTTFCGYGVYTDNFGNPPIEWDKNNTFIQNKGINQDFGLFATPDEFYTKHQQKLNPFQKYIFRKFVRHKMNKNVENIRNNN